MMIMQCISSFFLVHCPMCKISFKIRNIKIFRWLQHTTACFNAMVKRSTIFLLLKIQYLQIRIVSHIFHPSAISIVLHSSGNSEIRDLFFQFQGYSVRNIENDNVGSSGPIYMTLSFAGVALMAAMVVGIVVMKKRSGRHPHHQVC